MERDLSSLTHIEYEGMTILTDNRTEIWMTQKQIAELLGVSVQSVSISLTNALKKGDVELDSVIKYDLIAEDGKTYSTNHYNMNALLFVAFRADATEKVLAFRKWVREAVLERFIRDLEAQVETLKAKTASNGTNPLLNAQKLLEQRNYYYSLANRMIQKQAYESEQHQRLLALFDQIASPERERIHKILHELGHSF